jgi:hypothetical protein
MGHRAVAVVVRGRAGYARADHWAGARMLDIVLDGGPKRSEEVLDDMQAVGQLGPGYYWWEAGVLVDFPRKRVLWFGNPCESYVGEAPGDAATDIDAWRTSVQASWRGFELEKVNGAECFDEYLAHHKVKLRRVVTEEELRPVGADVEDGGEERRRTLREAEDRCDAPSPAKAPPWRTAPFVVVALLIIATALVARLLLHPFRARAREALRRRERERQARVLHARREALAREDARIAAAPDDERARIHRALLLPPRAGELELDRCVARLEAKPQGGERDRLLALALHDRGVLRKQLRLLRLGALDTARAAEMGLHYPGRSFGQWVFGVFDAFFFQFAGLIDP